MVVSNEVGRFSAMTIKTTQTLQPIKKLVGQKRAVPPVQTVPLPDAYRTQPVQLSDAQSLTLLVYWIPHITPGVYTFRDSEPGISGAPVPGIPGRWPERLRCSTRPVKTQFPGNRRYSVQNGI